MTNPQPSNPIRDILERLWQQASDAGRNGFMLSDFDEPFDQAEQALIAYFLELIGPDECPEGTIKLVGVPAFQRDLLRQELRTKLNGEGSDE